MELNHSALFVVVLCALVSLVSAHGYLTFPPARTGGNQVVKTGPCGGGAFEQPGAPVATFVVGQQYNLTWAIPGDHGGVVDFKLSTDGGKTFVTFLTDIDRRALAYNVTFTVPCKENCTLQWVWRPTSEGNYYGCADIVIEGEKEYDGNPCGYIAENGFSAPAENDVMATCGWYSDNTCCPKLMQNYEYYQQSVINKAFYGNGKCSEYYNTLNCATCSPRVLEYSYNETLRVCKSFLTRFWEACADVPGYIITDPNVKGKQLDFIPHKDGDKTYKDLAKFGTVDDFIYYQIKDHYIVVDDDVDTKTPCFSAASRATARNAALLVVLAIIAAAAIVIVGF